MKTEKSQLFWSSFLVLPLLFAGCKTSDNKPGEEGSGESELNAADGACSSVYIRDFSRWKGQVFDQTKLKQSFSCIMRGEPRIARPENISVDGSGALTFKMPEGKVGRDGSGGQFEIPVKASREYTLEYEVFFDGDGDYNWTWGGKLPGMAGGKPYYGGVPATAGDGFSGRFMFSGEGKIYAYIYHKDMEGGHGDPIGIEKAGALSDKKWNKIKIYYKMNTGTQANGAIKIWVNGQPVGEKSNLRYRTDGGLIDGILFSVFHGGEEQTYRPKKTQYIKFKEIRITPRAI